MQRKSNQNLPCRLQFEDDNYFPKDLDNDSSAMYAASNEE